MLIPLVGRGIPEAVVLGNNCKIVFMFNYTRTYCAVALQIEDYCLSSSTTPMRSVCFTAHKVIHIKEKWNERRETYVYIRFLLMNREMKEPFL